MDDEQVKNAMSEIKSQLRSASGAELARLSIAVGGLLNSAISPEMESQVKELQATVDQRAQEAEAAQSSQNISRGVKGRDDGDADKDKDLDKLAAINDKIYEAFSINHEEQLARKKAHTNNLSAALQATKDGKPLSEEDKKKLKRSDKQKKEEREHNKKLAASMKAAKAEEAHLKASINEIDSEISNPSQSPEKKQALQERRKQHVDRLGAVNEEVQKGNVEIGAGLAQIERVRAGKKAAQEKGVDQAVWAEQERDLADIVVSTIGSDVLLECAQKSGANTVEAVSEIIKNQKAMQEMLMEAMKQTIRQDPKAADKMREILGENTQIIDSSGPKIPPNTPNVNTTLPNKGQGGPGK